MTKNSFVAEVTFKYNFNVAASCRAKVCYFAIKETLVILAFSL